MPNAVHFEGLVEFFEDEILAADIINKFKTPADKWFRYEYLLVDLLTNENIDEHSGDLLENGMYRLYEKRHKVDQVIDLAIKLIFDEFPYNYTTLSEENVPLVFVTESGKEYTYYLLDHTLEDTGKRYPNTKVDWQPRITFSDGKTSYYLWKDPENDHRYIKSSTESTADIIKFIKRGTVPGLYY